MVQNTKVLRNPNHPGWFISFIITFLIMSPQGSPTWFSCPSYFCFPPNIQLSRFTLADASDIKDHIPSRLATWRLVEEEECPKEKAATSIVAFVSGRAILAFQSSFLSISSPQNLHLLHFMSPYAFVVQELYPCSDIWAGYSLAHSLLRGFRSEPHRCMPGHILISTAILFKGLGLIWQSLLEIFRSTQQFLSSSVTVDWK